MADDCCVFIFLRRSVDRNHLMRFHSETSVVKFLRRIVDGALIIFEKWPFVSAVHTGSRGLHINKGNAKFSRRKRAKGVVVKDLWRAGVSWLVLCRFPYSWWLLLIWSACLPIWDVYRRSKMLTVPLYRRSEFLLWWTDGVDVWGTRSRLTPISTNG